jgi:hypothetical protein
MSLMVRDAHYWHALALSSHTCERERTVSASCVGAPCTVDALQVALIGCLRSPRSVSDLRMVLYYRRNTSREMGGLA